MKVEDAVKILDENRANSVYNVYVPSMKKEYPFRFVTVGDQMSMAKMAMEDKQSVFYNGLMALIWKTYAGENFDKDIGIKNLNELDKMVILTEIKNHCSTNNLKYDLTCPLCNKKFQHTVKLENFAEKLKKMNMEPVIHEKTAFDTKFGFELNWPNMKTNLHLYRWAEGTNNDEDADNGEVEKERENNDKILYGLWGTLFSYVRRIWINDEEVEGFTEKKVSERMEFFYKLPDELIDTNDPDSVSSKIDENFNQPYLKLYTVKCPNKECGHKFDNFIDTENFFLNS